MNMLLHGIKFKNFSIANGDTLEHDEFPDRTADTGFDAVVANPPFSQTWSAAPKFLTGDDRFSKIGVLAPKSKADFAFILHMVYHLNDGGTMACVAPHGVLFRGNAGELSAVGSSRSATTLTLSSAYRPTSSTALPYPPA